MCSYLIITLDRPTEKPAYSYLFWRSGAQIFKTTLLKKVITYSIGCYNTLQMYSTFADNRVTTTSRSIFVSNVCNRSQKVGLLAKNLSNIFLLTKSQCKSAAGGKAIDIKFINIQFYAITIGYGCRSELHYLDMGGEKCWMRRMQIANACAAWSCAALIYMYELLYDCLNFNIMRLITEYRSEFFSAVW